jgi:hypothetical protein
VRPKIDGKAKSELATVKLYHVVVYWHSALLRQRHFVIFGVSA